MVIDNNQRLINIKTKLDVGDSLATLTAADETNQITILEYREAEHDE